METVTYIHAYPGAADTLALLWDGFKLLGWPLIGVDCCEEATRWPEPIPTIRLGVNKHWLHDRRNLPRRFIGTLRHFLSTRYDRACIMEYDTLVTGPLPDYGDAGLVAHLCGGQLPDAECPQFFHTPWLVDRKMAQTLIEEGTKLILDGTCDRGAHGSPDVFLGLLIDRLNLPWTESQTFAANTIEGPFITPAREAFAKGCMFFHGVKTSEHRENVIG